MKDWPTASRSHIHHGTLDIAIFFLDSCYLGKDFDKLRHNSNVILNASLKMLVIPKLFGRQSFVQMFFQSRHKKTGKPICFPSHCRFFLVPHICSRLLRSSFIPTLNSKTRAWGSAPREVCGSQQEEDATLFPPPPAAAQSSPAGLATLPSAIISHIPARFSQDIRSAQPRP